eukprot:TRINITY_DN2055_c0_g1_i2.p1 TRINITY_DN2055_c0_g1~~TRINITY_DN2055_c0_g1_i2.p1  ORF type:complete len:717 (-),score=87.88 TRINITY_DN2055_c0_g1_i2:3068-5218(-)
MNRLLHISQFLLLLQQLTLCFTQNIAQISTMTQSRKILQTSEKVTLYFDFGLPDADCSSTALMNFREFSDLWNSALGCSRCSSPSKLNGCSPFPVITYQMTTRGTVDADYIQSALNTFMLLPLCILENFKQYEIVQVSILEPLNERLSLVPPEARSEPYDPEKYPLLPGCEIPVGAIPNRFDPANISYSEDSESGQLATIQESFVTLEEDLIALQNEFAPEPEPDQEMESLQDDSTQQSQQAEVVNEEFVPVTEASQQQDDENDQGDLTQVPLTEQGDGYDNDSQYDGNEVPSTEDNVVLPLARGYDNMQNVSTTQESEQQVPNSEESIVRPLARGYENGGNVSTAQDSGFDALNAEGSDSQPIDEVYDDSQIESSLSSLGGQVQVPKSEEGQTTSTIPLTEDDVDVLATSSQTPQSESESEHQDFATSANNDGILKEQSETRWYPAPEYESISDGGYHSDNIYEYESGYRYGGFAPYGEYGSSSYPQLILGATNTLLRGNGGQIYTPTGEENDQDLTEDGVSSEENLYGSVPTVEPVIQQVEGVQEPGILESGDISEYYQSQSSDQFLGFYDIDGSPVRANGLQDDLSDAINCTDQLLSLSQREFCANLTDEESLSRLAQEFKEDSQSSGNYQEEKFQRIPEPIYNNDNSDDGGNTIQLQSTQQAPSTQSDDNNDERGRSYATLGGVLGTFGFCVFLIIVALLVAYYKQKNKQNN